MTNITLGNYPSTQNLEEGNFNGSKHYSTRAAILLGEIFLFLKCNWLHNRGIEHSGASYNKKCNQHPYWDSTLRYQRNHSFLL